MKYSWPRFSTSAPRWAPALSITTWIRLATSCGNRISLEMACEAFIADAMSSESPVESEVDCGVELVPVLVVDEFAVVPLFLRSQRLRALPWESSSWDCSAARSRALAVAPQRSYA